MSESGLLKLLYTIYAENSVEYILNGKAYARAVCAHLLVSLILGKLVIRKLNIDDDEKKILENIFEDFENMPPEKSTVEENVYLKNITTKFKQMLEKLENNGPTAKLWIQYFQMVTFNATL